MRSEWTIHALLEWTARFFYAKGISAPRLEAEILLARVLKQDRVYLYVNYHQPVNKEERSLFKAFVGRRVQGEPVAYIIGYKEFMSLKLKVNDQVLIPRPETEILVENTLEICKSLKLNRLCDIGTGSGAIAICLAFYCPQAQVFASDISAEALAIACENAISCEVQVDFRQGDLLAPFFNEAPFDVIIANLPYISKDSYGELMAEVKDYEPQLALLAGENGLEFYRRLIPGALEKLAPGGFFLFEISPEQKAEALELMENFSEVQVIKDYAGRDRVIKGRKGNNPNGDPSMDNRPD